jgi:DNA-binding response OmpR family regulator
MDIPRHETSVMVVDDNPLVTRALAALFRNHGYEPVVFQSGKPAMEFLKENSPDIALIDIHLPDMSGLEIVRKIREIRGQAVPVIVFSGDTSLNTLRALPDAGATHFFSKPLHSTNLLNFLKDWQNGQQAAGARI